jgi:hypothetical protein
MFKKRILPVGLVLLAAMPTTALLMVLLYSRGLPTTLSLYGVLVQLPVVALFVAALYLVLVRLKQLPREVAGLRLSARSATDVTVGVLLSVASTVGVYVLFSWLTGQPIALRSPAVSTALLVWGLPAFLLNAAVQQMSLQSVVVASANEGRKSLGPILFGILFFVGTHYSETATVSYLANVALFGILTTLAFLRKGDTIRDYALPIGFHAGWNYSQFVLLSAPLYAQPGEGLLRWNHGSDFWTGGSAGYDGGALFTLSLVPMVLFVLRATQQGAGQTGASASPVAAPQSP